MEKRVFEFNDYTVPVSIAGRDFKLNCSTKTGDYIKGVSGDLRTLADEIKSGTKTAGDAISYGMSVIDYLLGDGAAETVFEGRERTVSDITDLCIFLVQTVAEYHAERQKGAKNRAQRRAEKKK